MWQWSSRAISLTCHIMHSEIKPKACIVGVSFVNSVKEWYLVHLMSARGEWYLYPDLLIQYRLCWLPLSSTNVKSHEKWKLFLDAFDKPYLKYHETQISASIPVYALSKFEKKVFLNDLEYFYKGRRWKTTIFFFLLLNIFHKLKYFSPFFNWDSR